MTEKSPRTPCSDRSAFERVPLIGTKATADFHQGAQPPCCNPDAVYMAATEIMPASIEILLPHGSHPYRVRPAMNLRGQRIPRTYGRRGERHVPALPALRRTGAFGPKLPFMEFGLLGKSQPQNAAKMGSERSGGSPAWHNMM